MNKVFYPTDSIKKIERIFLGGTIDMGNSIDWQKETIESLKEFDVEIYNPRRINWNNGWAQTIENKQFNHQVSWELLALEKADVIIMNFLPESKSPISLLEFGLFHSKMMVCCPEGFYRKGNVDIVCKRYKVEIFDYYPNLLYFLKSKLSDIHNSFNENDVNLKFLD